MTNAPSEEKSLNIIIETKINLEHCIKTYQLPYYTYILRRPDDIVCYGGRGTPFYVGIGQKMRLFEHESEARKGKSNSKKTNTILEIWKQGKDIIRCIDGFFSSSPWNREEFLIRSIGQIKHATGPLTNEQDYSPSVKVDGIELRKYALHNLTDPNSIPANFMYAQLKLAAGPCTPKSKESVFGKIYNILLSHPGVTGEELVNLLKHIDFKDNKSAYTQSGQVCAAWLCGYIKGGFRPDRQHIKLFDERL